MDNSGDVLVRGVGGVACQHPNSVGNVGSGGHHEVHELADGGLEGSD